MTIRYSGFGFDGSHHFWVKSSHHARFSLSIGESGVTIRGALDGYRVRHARQGDCLRIFDCHRLDDVEDVGEQLS